MGRKSKHIKNLTVEEKVSLKKGYTYGKSPIFRRKCHCILLSHEGKTTKELASFFAISTISILKWFKQWETEGIKRLELQAGRGRKSKLDIGASTHVKVIKTLVENEPKNLVKVTAQIKKELGIEVSKKTLKRFLKNLNTVGNDLENV